MTKHQLCFDMDSGLFSRAGRVIGAKRPDGYIVVRFWGRVMLAHRVAWFICYGSWPANDIDHINGNRSDNRICNLRLATRAQNIAYKAHRNCNGFKGVSKHSNHNRKKRYGATIHPNGKSIFLGWFETAEDAGRAYAAAAEKHYGEFASVR